MGLDIRLPMGLMFTIIGVLLLGYGLVSDKTIYARSLGINVNVWWGLVMLAFGVLMLVLSRLGNSAMRPSSASREGERTEELEHREGLERERPRGGH
jgi:hypothetical protein